MYNIRRKGNLFVITDDTGVERGLYQDFETARIALEVLKTTRQQERALNPEIKERRIQKSAYRLVARDPWLKLLKKFGLLPVCWTPS